MSRHYKLTMTTDEKERLAMSGSIDLAACAIRLAAARIAAELLQKDVAAAIGKQRSAIGNMEQGRSFPSVSVMRYFYREHRIDFNFVMHGDFAQLPSDVQSRLFPALEAAKHEWDQKHSSNSGQPVGRPKLQAT